MPRSHQATNSNTNMNNTNEPRNMTGNSKNTAETTRNLAEDRNGTRPSYAEALNNTCNDDVSVYEHFSEDEEDYMSEEEEERVRVGIQEGITRGFYPSLADEEIKEYIPPIPGFSYASMAKKPCIQLPKFLKIDLGGKTFRVRYDSWHMVLVLFRNQYYCIACRVRDHIARKTAHCIDAAHERALARCLVLRAYQEHLVRQVDDKLAHCAHCNTLQVQNEMEEHLLARHPPALRNYVELAGARGAVILPQKTESDKSEIIDKRLLYSARASSRPPVHSIFNVSGDMAFSPFGDLLKIPVLNYHLITKRGELYYCVLCNAFCPDVEVHVKNPGHMQRTAMAPYIKLFYNHLIRAVHGALHCSLCNKMVITGDLFEHNLSPPHTDALAAALGMVRGRPPPEHISSTEQLPTAPTQPPPTPLVANVPTAPTQAPPTPLVANVPTAPTQAPPTPLVANVPTAPTQAPPTALVANVPTAPTQAPQTQLVANVPTAPTQAPPTLLVANVPTAPTQAPPTPLVANVPTAPTQAPPTPLVANVPTAPTQPPPTPLVANVPTAPTQAPPTPLVANVPTAPTQAPPTPSVANVPTAPTQAPQIQLVANVPTAPTQAPPTLLVANVPTAPTKAPPTQLEASVPTAPTQELSTQLVASVPTAPTQAPPTQLVANVPTAPTQAPPTPLVANVPTAPTQAPPTPLVTNVPTAPKQAPQTQLVANVPTAPTQAPPTLLVANVPTAPTQAPPTPLVANVPTAPTQAPPTLLVANVLTAPTQAPPTPLVANVPTAPTQAPPTPLVANVPTAPTQAPQTQLVANVPTALTQSPPTLLVANVPTAPTQAPPTPLVANVPTAPTQAPPTLLVANVLTAPTQAPPTLLVASVPTAPTQEPPTHLVANVPTAPTQAPPTLLVANVPTALTQAPPTLLVANVPTAPTQAPPTPLVANVPTSPTQAPQIQLVANVPTAPTQAPPTLLVANVPTAPTKAPPTQLEASVPTAPTQELSTQLVASVPTAPTQAPPTQLVANVPTAPTKAPPTPLVANVPTAPTQAPPTLLVANVPTVPTQAPPTQLVANVPTAPTQAPPTPLVANVPNAPTQAPPTQLVAIEPPVSPSPDAIKKTETDQNIPVGPKVAQTGTGQNSDHQREERGQKNLKSRNIEETRPSIGRNLFTVRPASQPAQIMPMIPQILMVNFGPNMAFLYVKAQAITSTPIFNPMFPRTAPSSLGPHLSPTKTPNIPSTKQSTKNIINHGSNLGPKILIISDKNDFKDDKDKTGSSKSDTDKTDSNEVAKCGTGSQTGQRSGCDSEGFKTDNSEDETNSEIEDKHFDEEEIVIIKFKNNYFKITNSSYHSLVVTDEENVRHCFLCSTRVLLSGARAHVASKRHVAALQHNQFLDKYGLQLYRQMFLIYHCATCNKMLQGKELRRHAASPPHAEAYALQHTDLKSARRELKAGGVVRVAGVQREAVYRAACAPDQPHLLPCRVVSDVNTTNTGTESSGAGGDETRVKRNKMVIYKDTVLVLSFEQWHSVTYPSDTLARCALCQIKMVPGQVWEHTASAEHVAALATPVESAHLPALIRRIDASSVQCITCNVALTGARERVVEHAAGRRHALAVQAAQRQHAHTDCYADCLVL